MKLGTASWSGRQGNRGDLCSWLRWERRCWIQAEWFSVLEHTACFCYFRSDYFLPWIVIVLYYYTSFCSFSISFRQLLLYLPCLNFVKSRMQLSGYSALLCLIKASLPPFSKVTCKRKHISFVLVMARTYEFHGFRIQENSIANTWVC